MPQLTLNVTLTSTGTDGNVSDWFWSIDGTQTDDTPPPRMAINDTFNIVVTDSANAPNLGALVVLSAKIENPLKGLGNRGQASPLKTQGPNNSTNAVCYQLVPAQAASGQGPSGSTYTLNPANSTLLVKGAWELTVVITRSDLSTQFELDPEFDVSSGN